MLGGVGDWNVFWDFRLDIGFMRVGELLLRGLVRALGRYIALEEKARFSFMVWGIELEGIAKEINRRGISVNPHAGQRDFGKLEATISVC